MRDIFRRILGRARDLRDPHVFHQMSLVAFLAWVGLGADGLSSSSYGPEEAFKAIGHWEPAGCYSAAKDVAGCHFIPDHAYLAVFLAGAIAATVFIISWSYRRIIEEFPHGGGGYIVASKHLGPYVGAVSGSALLVDYVLTIAISLASGADAIFNFLPDGWLPYKLATVLVVLALLTLMNLRGVKESVTILTPIFLVFLVTHAILIFGAIGTQPRPRRRDRDDGVDRARTAHQHGRHARRRARVHARVLARRRHVHRHRGGLERPRDHARAARAHREAHDAADGDVARDHGERHLARVPAAPRHRPRRARR